MKRTFILIIVALTMNLHCGTIAAKTTKSIGDYPIGNNQKGEYYA